MWLMQLPTAFQSSNSSLATYQDIASDLIWVRGLNRAVYIVSQDILQRKERETISNYM